MRRPFGFRFLIITGIFLCIMFLAGQTLSLIDHDLTVALGLQESEAEITKTGIAFAKGFALGDTICYLPLFAAGIIGLLRRKAWGPWAMFGALAITVYWPVVHLYAMSIGRDSMHLSSSKHLTYAVILPLIALYGLWGMWFLYRNRGRLADGT
jgi:hypothetical protein